MESNQSTCGSRSLQQVVRQYPLFFYAHASVDCPEADGLLALFPGVSMIGMHWALLIGFGVQRC